MKIYIIQPGQNDGHELTEEGVWQIKTLARILRVDDFEADCVYTNGHSISTETGKILSRALHIKMISDDRFEELSKDAFNDSLNENDLETMDFVNLFVNELIEKGKDAIITVADGIHRQIISRLTGLSLKDTKHFSLWPASISLVSLNKLESTEKWRITYLNDTNHLRIP